MSSELPYYETLYGVRINDWGWDYGSGVFSNEHNTLTKDYLNEGCSTEDWTQVASSGSSSFVFLYPHWIKKQYYIEGVIEGHFSLSCNGGDDQLNEYRVRLMKVDDIGNISEIASTGYKPLVVVFTWDAVLSVGTERVVPFYITVSPEAKMLDKERLYLELIINTDDNHMILYHSNDSTWEDLKISIPFRGL
jgi:hypothetical protein